MSGKNRLLFDRAAHLFSVVLLLASCLVSTSLDGSVEQYTYYGVVPAKIHRMELDDMNNLSSGWLLVNGTEGSSGLVAIIASEGNTNVQVYSLPDGRLVSQANLNSMEKHYALFPNGSIFKVTSDRVVSVALLSGGIPASNASEGPLPSTYYTATDGAYVGRKFVFIASQLGGTPYIIFALENSRVTVTGEDGSQNVYTLQPNSFQRLMLKPFRAYKVESTGAIMIQCGAIGGRYDARRSYAVPSAEGGFVGKVFYSGSTTDWDSVEGYGFQISATSDAKVSVWNLETKQKLEEVAVKGGGSIGVKPKAEAFIMQSDKPVTVTFIHNGSIRRLLLEMYGAYGSGVAYIGVKANEETAFFLPTESNVEAYVFASELTKVTIDDVSRPIQPHTYFALTHPGSHKIVTDKNVIIQVLHWPSTPPNQGIQFGGSVIPSVQTVNVVPQVTLTPLGEGFPWLYVAIGAAAAVAAAVGYMVVRGRAKTRIKP